MRNGKKVDMVSPIEGSVADINEEAIRNPQLAISDAERACKLMHWNEAVA